MPDWEETTGPFKVIYSTAEKADSKNNLDIVTMHQNTVYVHEPKTALSGQTVGSGRTKMRTRISDIAFCLDPNLGADCVPTIRISWCASYEDSAIDFEGGPAGIGSSADVGPTSLSVKS